MRTIKTAITLLLFVVWAGGNATAQGFVRHSFSNAKQVYMGMLAKTDGRLNNYPHSVFPDGKIKYSQLSGWTAGFWPGILWYMYAYTRDDHWKKQATIWTESMESNQYNTAHHDIGFMMYTSYGNALRQQDNPAYKKILIQSARSLCKRYSPSVGSIQSWNTRKSMGGVNTWEYPVIMDNMMNLELLFYAYRATGDSSFYKIAVSHADKTMENHIRPDYSSFHVVNYDPASGNVLHKQTLQGFSDNSTWARGQAWGIYGFTTTYRETRDKRFLQTAVGMADFFLNHNRLPADKIPYWDFNAGQDGYKPDWAFDATRYKVTPRDASAAAITASALLELAEYVGKTKRRKYSRAAAHILKSLSSTQYMSSPASPYTPFLLNHSTGHLPGGREIDVPLVYADYYFLEALLRYKKLIPNL